MGTAGNAFDLFGSVVGVGASDAHGFANPNDSQVRGDGSDDDLFRKAAEARRELDALLRGRDEWLKDSDVTWVVDGLVREGGLHMLYGDTSVGKSTVAVSLAAHIATGTRWHGRDVQRRHVYYFALEGYGGIVRRAIGYESILGVRLEDLRFGQEFDFEAERECSRVWMSLFVRPRGVLVVDTLSRAASGLDIDRHKDASAIVEACMKFQSLGHTVILVHHSGHRAYRATGSKVFANSCDGVFRLEKKAGGVSLTVEKLRDWRAGARYFGSLEAVTSQEGVVPCYRPESELEDSDQLPARGPDRLSARHVQLLTTLRTLTGDGPGVSQADWNRGLPKPLSDVAMATARRWLQSNGYVNPPAMEESRRGTLYSLTDKGLEAIGCESLTSANGVSVDGRGDCGASVA